MGTHAGTLSTAEPSFAGGSQCSWTLLPPVAKLWFACVRSRRCQLSHYSVCRRDGYAATFRSLPHKQACVAAAQSRGRGQADNSARSSAQGQSRCIHRADGAACRTCSVARKLRTTHSASPSLITSRRAMKPCTWRVAAVVDTQVFRVWAFATPSQAKPSPLRAGKTRGAALDHAALLRLLSKNLIRRQGVSQVYDSSQCAEAPLQHATSVETQVAPTY